MITPETLRLAEGYVEVKSLGPVPVKGLADAVEVYELTGAGTARTRLQAAALRGLTRFVGRDAEVEHLRRVLGQADGGRGQVVAIVGEAGVGKSRLTYEFTHSHRVQDWLILEASSVSYGKATSYLPVIDLLKGYFKIGDRDDHREMRAKVLGRVLGLDRALEPQLPPLLALLDVPVEDPGWQNLDPPQRRQRTLDAVKRLLLRESQVQPLLVVFEDLHWIDGETQALLDSLVESLASARLLLLVNYRPEYEHRWGSKTAYSQLRLDSLPAESAAELVAALLGPDPGLAPLTQMLVKRGNPFFLEETVRTLVETGALAGERGAYRLTRPVQALQVPATVQTILAARIDRLPAEEKQLLQAASVIGKHVPYALLAAIAEQPEEALRRGLAHLQEAEFLYETQLFPDLEYTFKHALTHDVAYAGLLGERRRTLHVAVAAAIERLHVDRLVEHVERLAHHARQGEVWDKAVRYLRQAGTKVFLRSANREAATCFEQALDALRRLPEHPDAIAESLDIRFDLRNALQPLGEQGRVGAILDEAEALAEAVGDQRRLGRTLNFKVIQFGRAGDFGAAIQTGLRALAIGEAQADVAIQVVANDFLAAVYVARGECREGVRHCEAALALIPEGLAQERFGDAAIQGSYVRDMLARALGALGRFAEAFVRLREAIQIAEEAGHVFRLSSPSSASALSRSIRATSPARLPRWSAASSSAGRERFPTCSTTSPGRWARRTMGPAAAPRGSPSWRTPPVASPGGPCRWRGGPVASGRSAGRTSSTGGWRTPPGSPRKGWRRLGSGATGGGGPRPATARRHRGPSRPLRGRYRGGALSPGPGPGRGAGPAPAQGALPPRAGRALPAHGQAPAGARVPRERCHAVPRDGHALLAGAGGGRDAGVGMRTTALAILGLSILVVALTAEDPSYRGGAATLIS